MDIFFLGLVHVDPPIVKLDVHNKLISHRFHTKFVSSIGMCAHSCIGIYCLCFHLALASVMLLLSIVLPSLIWVCLLYWDRLCVLHWHFSCELLFCIVIVQFCLPPTFLTLMQFSILHSHWIFSLLSCFCLPHVTFYTTLASPMMASFLQFILNFWSSFLYSQFIFSLLLAFTFTFFF